jgi:hypothetical protein
LVKAAPAGCSTAVAEELLVCGDRGLLSCCTSSSAGRPGRRAYDA